MLKLIIIGASYLQVPLILKAKEMNIETHVFAWEEGAVGKNSCDFFYPISINEKEKILEYSQKIQPDGVVSIASDLATITVNYIAGNLRLIGNSRQCTKITTDKYEMRKALSADNLPCPKFVLYKKDSCPDLKDFNFPLIVKPTDRSGSRGITKVLTIKDLEPAISRAVEESIDNNAIIEEFIEGKEISVEMISWKGEHHYICCTDKETFGPPNFVEIGQHQPANLSEYRIRKIVQTVNRALSCLKVEYGASHTELLIDKDENIFIVEVGARMGGDHIGSHLVPLSTGFDFTKAVIEVALGSFNNEVTISRKAFSGIIYIEPKNGRITGIENNVNNYPEIVKHEIFVSIGDRIKNQLKESNQRIGYYIYCSGEKKFVIDKHKIINVITE